MAGSRVRKLSFLKAAMCALLLSLEKSECEQDFFYLVTENSLFAKGPASLLALYG